MSQTVRKKLLYAAVAATVACVAYFLFFDGEKGEIRYATAEVSKGEITSLVRASGTLEPTRVAKIYPDISGTVIRILTDTNDGVAEGQTLALIEDPGGLRERAEQFRAVLEKTETDLRIFEERHSSNTRLYEKRLISKEELERSSSERSRALSLREKAKADLEAAEKKLEKIRVTSTLDGVVLERNVTVGERIRPGSKVPLFVLGEDLRRLHLISDVGEADIGKIKKGQKTAFRVDAFPGRGFAGEVAQVSNSPKNRNGVVTYDVTCAVENPELELKPGMTTEVRILISTKKNALLIPTAALRFIPPRGSGASAPEAGQTVWTLRSGKLEAVPVETGISDDSRTEITGGGLSLDDKIVTGYSFSGKEEKGPAFTLPQPKRF